MKKSIFTFLFLLFGLVFIPSFCEAYNPEIVNYNVDVEVNENRVYFVKEKIKVLYYSPMTFFERIIPLEGYTIRSNEKDETYNIKISDIKADRETSSYKDFNNKEHIKIGNEKKYVNGSQTYQLSYLYKVSVDKMNKKNEFYFPLITPGWNAPIPKFSFTVKMPKKFDENKISFYDKFGMATSVKYDTKDNYIKGFYNGTLYPNDTLTIKIDLPKNYFKKTFSEIIMPFIDLISYIFPLLILIVVFIIRNFYKEKKSDKPEMVPPDNYSPLEISYIFRQKINYSDIAVLIFTLANKGYIKIEQYKDLESDNNYKLIKVKNYDGQNKYEKTFMNYLFANGIDFITAQDLAKLSFQNTSKTIMNDIKNRIKPIFDKKFLCVQNITIFLMILSWFMLCLYIGIKAGFAFYIILLFILPISSYYLLSRGIKGFSKNNKNAKLYTFIGCVILILTIAVIADAFLINNPQLFLSILITFISVILMDLMKSKMIKFPLKANDLYLKVLNFRKFIEKFEPVKLQRFIEKDNYYFYKILPYAYIYGLSNNWLKKFEYVNCPPPKYYNGDTFYKGVLDGIMNNIISVIEENSTAK